MTELESASTRATILRFTPVKLHPPVFLLGFEPKTTESKSVMLPITPQENIMASYKNYNSPFCTDGRIRTLNKGFGDLHDTISPHPYLPVHLLKRIIRAITTYSFVVVEDIETPTHGSSDHCSTSELYYHSPDFLLIVLQSPAFTGRHFHSGDVFEVSKGFEPM